MAYLLDTNIFIQSEHYIPRDIFPSFWAHLGNTLQDSTAVLHQTVLEELEQKKDPLITWIEHLKVTPLQPDDDVLESYLQICAWAESQAYDKNAVRTFQSEKRADAWLCAQALSSGLTVATYEVPSNSPRVIKIPTVCDAFHVNWINGFDFMREQRFRF